MRVALLKDPEIRARIETPLPAPVLPEGEIAEGAAPPPPTDAAGTIGSLGHVEALENPVTPVYGRPRPRIHYRQCR